jgi:hypothetical protein
MEAVVKLKLIFLVLLSLLFLGPLGGSDVMAGDYVRPAPNPLIKLVAQKTVKNYTPIRADETGVSCTSTDGSATCDCPNKCVKSTSDCRCE